MRKFIFITLMMAAFVSCSTVNYVGNNTGKGVSVDEQVAVDKSFLAAGVEASRQNNVTFSERITKTTEDNGGSATTKYVSIQTAETNAVFTNNTIKKQVRMNGDRYVVTTQFSGTPTKLKE